MAENECYICGNANPEFSYSLQPISDKINFTSLFQLQYLLNMKI